MARILKEANAMTRHRARLQRTVILILLLTLSLAGWTYMLQAHDHSVGLAPMHHATTASSSHSWSLLGFTTAFIVWAVMMIAMMTPSVIPMVLGFIRIRQRARVRHLYGSAMAFLSGYFLIWLLFCALATAAQFELQTLALLSPTLESQNILLSAVLLLLAGLYQFTPWKAACLKHCRTANGVLADCHRNAARVGIHHGFNCVGSCWALMIMMFAVGVLNLPWMAIITLIVVLEKVLPINPIWLRCSTGLAFSAWGGWLLMPIWM